MSGTAAAATPKLTDAELAVAEAFTSVLDLVSRLKSAIDGGEAYYGSEKALALRNRAERLQAALDRSLSMNLTLRGPLIAAAMVEMAAPYAAGRALYPPHADGASSAPVVGASSVTTHAVAAL